MLTVAEAQQAILHECRPLPPVAVPLTEAAGLVLAEAIVSDRDSPPFDKSMMDGYAVRSDDLAFLPADLAVIGQVLAGETFPEPLRHGAAVRIMTGAPIPAGADAVVRSEDTAPTGDRVRILAGASSGANIIRRGQMLSAGETVLSPGRRLRPQEIALLAELGRASIHVHRRPTAAVLATGDELVPPGQPPGPGQICNSNESLLVAQLRGWGCDAVGLGIARDRPEELHAKISAGLERDILVLTGGVSMGVRDLVPQVLSELGARQVFHKVQLKPGKPAWFGIRDGRGEGTRTAIFALPGNPVSSMVCSELFVRPAIATLMGNRFAGPRILPARLARDHRHCEDRPTYFPARLELRSDGLQVTPTGWQGSADIRSTTDANALIVFPPGDCVYPCGGVVDVIPFGDPAGGE